MNKFTTIIYSVTKTKRITVKQMSPESVNIVNDSL